MGCCIIYFVIKTGGAAKLLEGALQAGGALKANGLGGFDLHSFTSLGVATLTGSTAFDGESAKSNKLDFTIFLNTGSDAAKHCFQCVFCCTLSSVFSKGLLNGFDEFGFIHNVACYALFEC